MPGKEEDGTSTEDELSFSVPGGEVVSGGGEEVPVDEDELSL